MWAPVNRTLLISDANVVIDIIDGGLLEGMFSLEYEYGIPDLLYEDELRVNHSELSKIGLQIMGQSDIALNDTTALYEKYRKSGVSVYDCMALSLARQHGCPLLTGDGVLRQAAMIEKIVVRGTIWLVEQMIKSGVISADRANAAYLAMKEKGSRLPWDEVRKQISQYSAN